MSEGQDIPGKSSLYPALCVSISLIPAAFLLWKITQFGYFFPYWDAWHFTPFIAKTIESHVTLADFWVMHNEHRPMIPRMIMLALASASRWDVTWDIMTNLAFGAGIFLVVAHLLLRITSADGQRYWGTLPLAAIIAFSWGQMENWIWGWQMMVFMSVYFVCQGVAILAQGNGNTTSLALGILMGYLATFSFANGMLYWFAALPVVLLIKDTPIRRRLPHLASWVLAAALALALYFYQYEKPGVSPSLLDALRMPLAFSGYLILYISGPVDALYFKPTWHGQEAPVGPLHFVPGLVGIALMAALLLWFLRTRRAPWHALAPWLSLAAYATASGFVTAIARVGFGLEHGVTSRYMTIANLFWFALLGLVLCYFAYAPRRERRSPDRPLSLGAPAFLKTLALALLATLTCLGTSHANTDWERLASWKKLGWRAIQMGFWHPVFLHDVSGQEPVLRQEYLPFLQKNNLCGITDPPRKDPALAPVYREQAQYFEQAGMLPQARVYYAVTVYLNPDDTAAKQKMEELRAQIKKQKLESAQEHEKPME